ncbi:hypothetical protein VY88_31655 [Azospirillum thiophilum]|uniref:Uncharacterized protein n=1 Tax=Azospirillum thiophilum TaxID=528244 RepID=A0AAC8VZP7_9PROT|nr:hypothetical protein [Azospirillum thiophilum]ALG72316.1 hypothetical protein AL072_14370 [Azospirillum thiophilum]KJR61280.1 hypothetical protein VY88_31655 [Azospirillum thiophilum]
MTKPPLLLYLAHGGDPQRVAVAPVLAAAAERAGWAFDLYYDGRRSGRHFGGWEEGNRTEATGSGSLMAGGRHLDHALWLTTCYRVVALGDPASPLWPVVESSGECALRSSDPAALYETAFRLLGQPIPDEVAVLDMAPQTPLGIVAAPFLYPRLMAAPCLGIEAGADVALRERLEVLGARRFVGVCVDPVRARRFPGGLDAVEGKVAGESYASFSAGLARRHAAWGRGTLLGDPDLIAAQLPLAAAKRLLPLYGRPQTDVIERAADLIRTGADPVYGRQFDDHDFFALGRLGRGLQIVDPDPPFASTAALPLRIPEPPRPVTDFEPDDATLRRWAAEGRVLTTLVLWSGMIRELHCIPRILDLVAATGLRCGLVVTVDSLTQSSPADLALLAVPEERGGVLGRVELLLGSTGRGVCAEGEMDEGELGRLLTDARAEVASMLPPGLMPRGWWPLVDAPLVPGRTPRLHWEEGHPVLRISPRPRPAETPAAGATASEDAPSHIVPAPAAPIHTAPPDAPPAMDARRLIGNALRRYRLDRFYEAWRPYDSARPGPIRPEIAAAVRAAGFDYMWTKAGFGSAGPALVDGGFVALPFTAGDWDGWSPFYTLRNTAQVRAAERRLTRSGKPGWLASNIDSILWMLPGEVLEKGRALFQVAQLVAGGGGTGTLVNVTPHTVARYARILADATAERSAGSEPGTGAGAPDNPPPPDKPPAGHASSTTPTAARNTAEVG